MRLAKTDDKIVVKAGVYDGKLLDKAEVAQLAAIPGREQLLAMLLGVMQAPVSGFVRALAALAEKQQGGATEQAADAEATEAA